MKKKILVLGAGGHALDVIDLLLNEQDEFEPIGVLDPKATGSILGVPVLGDDRLLVTFKKDVNYAFPAIGFGSGVNNTLRQKVFKNIQEEGFIVPNLISSKAFVRSGVTMGVGNCIQAGCIIDTQASLGDNIAFGFNVLVGHGCRVGSHVTLSGGVIFNGGVSVGEGSFLGMGCILYKNIGSWSKVSPGAVCMEEVADRMVAFGNPARCMPNLQLK